MRILDSKASSLADKITIRQEGIHSSDLMERACLGFVGVFLEKFKVPGKGLIVCGPGNNGGDGLGIARLLAENGILVEVYCPDCFQSYSFDYEQNMNKIQNSVLVHKGSAEHLEMLISGFDWICDGLFGTGLNRPIEGKVKKLVQIMNRFEGLKCAIDTPTGLMPEMAPGFVAFQSDWTGTFQTPKLPFLLPDTGKFVDSFSVIDIGLHTEKAEENCPPFFYLEANDIDSILKPRKKFTHKGTYGHGLMIAGSKGKMGAAVLATKAMLRSGVGLATVAVPECGTEIVQTTVPEAISQEMNHELELASFQAAGIGPGLGISKKAEEMLLHVLENSGSPVVLDADALNIISTKKEWVSKIPENSILTPHPKEFERLTTKSESGLKALEKALDFARSNKVYLVLKGAHTVICTPEGEAFYNSTGNPGMATGGSGDVLAGILTGLLAQGYSPKNACLSGVYIHGLAGDLAAEEMGSFGMIAGDIVDYLPKAFLCFEFK